MTAPLNDLLNLLRSASNAVEIFGTLAGDQQAVLKRRYRELVLIAHPDRNLLQVAEANEALRLLQGWYQQAQHQLAEGSYGRVPAIVVVTSQSRYTGWAAPWHGDLCDLYPASGAGGQSVLKIARNPRNNDLLAAEAAALRQIDRALAGQGVRAHFPTLIERFTLRDTNGIVRQGNVLRAETGYYTLAELLQAYPAGIDAADAAWMFKRVLAALGNAHDLGLVHGAVLPEHILICPEDHNGMLIDWCYSVEAGSPLKAISPRYAGEYPPEARARRPATPATDLFLAARCMSRLLGGQGGHLELPSSVPKPIRALLRACLIEAPQRRAGDAWQVYDDFDRILADEYGPPSFRPFQMMA